MVNEVSITIANEGERQIFEDISIEGAIDNLSSSFSFKINAPDNIADLISKVGAPIVIAIDGRRLLTGNVERVEIESSPEAHSVRFAGRDKTGDIVDSSLRDFQLNANISFKETIRQILQSIGFNAVIRTTPPDAVKDKSPEVIGVVDNANVAPFSEKELIKIKNGENAWDVIRRLAQKRQVLITSNEYGDVVISKVASIGKAGTKIQLLTNAKADKKSLNNVKSFNYTLDHTSRFNKYIITSQVDNKQVASSIPPEKRKDVLVQNNKVVGQLGQQVDPQVRVSRQSVNIAPVSMTSAECASRALWEANIQKTNSFVVNYKLYSFTYPTSSGFEIWKRNQLVEVEDEFTGIKTDMLIRSVTYNQNVTSGTTVDLALIDSDAYQLILSEPNISKSKADTNILFSNV